MAAFPTTRKHVHLPGQGSVEFILVMPVLLTFLFAIGSFAMLSYQNTVIQHSLATLADAPPPDGSSKTETSSSATSSAAAPTSTRAGSR